MEQPVISNNGRVVQIDYGEETAMKLENGNREQAETKGGLLEEEKRYLSSRAVWLAAIDEVIGRSCIGRLHLRPQGKRGQGGNVSGDAAKWERKIPTRIPTTHVGATNAHRA